MFQLDIKIILPILIGLLYFIISKREEILLFFYISRRELKKYLYLNDNVEFKSEELKKFIDNQIQKHAFRVSTGLKFSKMNIEILNWYNLYMKDVFSPPQLRDIAEFMKKNGNNFIINIDEVKKKTIYKIIFWSILFTSILILILLIYFNFFPDTKNDWIIYGYLGFVLFISQWNLMIHYFRLNNAKKFINHFQKEEKILEKNINTGETSIS